MSRFGSETPRLEPGAAGSSSFCEWRSDDARRTGPRAPRHSFLCEPSQSGSFLVALQPQKKALPVASRRIGEGLDARALMGAVAEGLLRAPAAGAPIIGFPLLDLDGHGFLLENDAFDH